MVNGLLRGEALELGMVTLNRQPLSDGDRDEGMVEGAGDHSLAVGQFQTRPQNRRGACAIMLWHAPPKIEPAFGLKRTANFPSPDLTT